MDAVPRVYAALFSVPFVVSLLQKDMTNGAKHLRAAAAAVPAGGGDTLQGVVAHEVSSLGVDPGIRRSLDCGAISLLWLNRASAFITRLIRALADGRKPNEAAAEAYAQVLAPYHAFVTRNVVGTAMGLAPPKDAILQRLELPSEAVATEQMLAFLARMEPLVDAVRAIIESHGLDFSDRV